MESLTSVPTKPLAYESQWKRTTAVPLTRENFLDLLHGKTPLIKESGFLTPEISWKYEKELSPKLTPYKHNTGPLLTKVGVAQFEYQAQAEQDFASRTNGISPLSFPYRRLSVDFAIEKEQYFNEAKNWADLHSSLAHETGVNAWAAVVDRVASLVPDWDVEVASEGQNKYFQAFFVP
ncbi:hypothetical protein MMC18_006396 [Xylographa bjoerkii]|nr:hypothetical protein [Xylographa bjoerkii]